MHEYIQIFNLFDSNPDLFTFFMSFIWPVRIQQWQLDADENKSASEWAGVSLAPGEM